MGLFKRHNCCVLSSLDLLKLKLESKSRLPIPQFSGYHCSKKIKMVYQQKKNSIFVLIQGYPHRMRPLSIFVLIQGYPHRMRPLSIFMIPRNCKIMSFFAKYFKTLSEPEGLA